MNEEKMKNMVVLKDIPSNIVEEAYVLVKPNIKVKQKVESLSETKKQEWPVYIIKEAESVISNYVTKIENNNNIRNIELEKLKKKYIKLRKFCMALGIFLVIVLLLQINY